MRVLACTTAGAGHFGPLVPFARACADAGHEVAVAAPESFADQVTAAGFEHHPFADAPAEAMGQVFSQVPSMSFEDANAVVVSEVFGRLDAQAALPGLVQVIDRWRPEVILRDPVEFGSLAAAEAAGVPQVHVGIGVGSTWTYVASLLDEPLRELDSLAGLPEGTCARAMSSVATLTIVPELLDDPGPADPTADPTVGMVHRFCDTSQAGADGGLPKPWGDPAHPLVYVSFGSVAAGVAGFGGLYPEVVAAFADQPVRVLLTTGHGVEPADLEPLPTNVHVEPWWPQSDVMPHCAAAVGHGGFGTTMAALGAGVPQVVVPLFSFDQRINAEHVAGIGAGLHLEGGPDAMRFLPGAVARLVHEPRFREKAGSMAEAMAALPPIASAVDVLEQVARR